MGVGMGGGWVLFLFLTYVTHIGYTRGNQLAVPCGLGMRTLNSAQCPTSSANERSLNELPELIFLSCAARLPVFGTQISHNFGFLTFFFLWPLLPTITKSVVPGISSTS